MRYADANLARHDRPGEPMRFVEFRQEVTGSDPRWLYSDSKVVDHLELTRVDQRELHFVTIRRPGSAIVRRLKDLPPPASPIAYLEESVRLRGYDGPIRRIAVTGLGGDRPTRFLSIDFE